MPLTDGMAITLLGTLWIGLAIAHAVLLRELPHGDGDRASTILVGHVRRRHGRLPRRAHVRHAAARAARSRPTRRSRGSCSASSAPRSRSGARAVPGLAGGSNALLLGARRRRAAPIGDLFESKVKRDAGTKDAGTLFGAHGGALDRLDAALFTLVGGYYMWLVLHVTDDGGAASSDRQMIELLNELRVALPGVQILFAFLLTVPFSVRFEEL